MTVDKARVALLVEALRGNEFKQGRNSLMCGTSGVYTVDPASADSYCCLGVAQVVALRNGYDGEVTWHQGGLCPGIQEWYGFNARYTRDIGFSRAAVEASGFPMPDGTEDWAYTAATAANDFVGATFPQIAAAFEYEYITEGAA